MTTVRREVRRHIQSNPGVHFNELARNLDIATGQAQYHVRRLLDDGSVDSEELRGQTHYFPDGYDQFERRTLALLRRETVRALIVHALDAGEPSAADLAEDLDVARSTVSWHISTLVEAGVAEKTYDAQGRTHIRLTDPEATQTLLQEVKPSLPDKLVDRFTRLIDSSIYG
jgi:predicted transcriptional regulator